MYGAMGALALFLAFCVSSPVLAWPVVEWHTGDPCIWEAGCDAGGGMFTNEIAMTTVTQTCSLAQIYAGTTMTNWTLYDYTHAEYPEFWGSSSQPQPFSILGMVTTTIGLKTENGDITRRVTDLLIECLDLPPEGYDIVREVSYGEGGVMLGVLFMGGLLLLDVFVRLSERLTDR